MAPISGERGADRRVAGGGRTGPAAARTPEGTAHALFTDTSTLTSIFGATVIPR